MDKPINNSKTAGISKKKPRGKPFVKGDDRINRDGRPGKEGFEYIQGIARGICEEVGKDGLTAAEKILRQWAESKNWLCQKALLEYSYGKVPDIVKNETDGQDLSQFAAALKEADNQ